MSPATRMVPAIAVPRDEPRFDTLRDRPEISPWRSSAKLACTRLTDGVSMPPSPKPMRNSPGAKAQALGGGLASAMRTPIPTIVSTKPARIRVRCARRRAKRSAASDDEQDADRRRGEDHACLDRVVAADDLQVGGDGERDPEKDQPLDVLRDEAEVGDAVAEQARREQRLLACGLLRAHGQEEPDQHQRARDDQPDQEPAVVVGREDPHAR